MGKKDKWLIMLEKVLNFLNQNIKIPFSPVKMAVSKKAKQILTGMLI
jgi:hypothetical protein